MLSCLVITAYTLEHASAHQFHFLSMSITAWDLADSVDGRFHEDHERQPESELLLQRRDQDAEVGGTCGLRTDGSITQVCH